VTRIAYFCVSPTPAETLPAAVDERERAGPLRRGDRGHGGGRAAGPRRRLRRRLRRPAHRAHAGLPQQCDGASLTLTSASPTQVLWLTPAQTVQLEIITLMMTCPYLNPNPNPSPSTARLGIHAGLANKPSRRQCVLRCGRRARHTMVISLIWYISKAAAAMSLSSIM